MELIAMDPVAKVIDVIRMVVIRIVTFPYMVVVVVVVVVVMDDATTTTTLKIVWYYCY